MAHSHSAIVVLPTGAGKTLIAAAVIKTKMKRSLFLVPTCLLVSQQASALRHETGLRVKEYQGGHAPPDGDYNVLVSTPAAFLDLKLSLDEFVFIVFDEVHHVLKVLIVFDEVEASLSHYC
jgi:superfamily II DNA or RNA helicase